MKTKNRSVRKKTKGKTAFLLLLLAAVVLCAAFLFHREMVSNAQFTVCLDAGHGGKDPGCLSGERRESDDNLSLTLAVRNALEKRGVRVILTRSDDTFLSLEQRCRLANEKGADYFLSFHRNTAEGDACGVEVWRSHSAGEESVALANALLKGLDSVGIQRNRGVQVGSQGDSSSDYFVLSHTRMPCVLLEMGFMQNEEDNRLFDEKQAAYASAIAEEVSAVWREFHG